MFSKNYYRPHQAKVVLLILVLSITSSHLPLKADGQGINFSHDISFGGDSSKDCKQDYDQYHVEFVSNLQLTQYSTFEDWSWAGKVAFDSNPLGYSTHLFVQDHKFTSFIKGLDFIAYSSIFGCADFEGLISRLPLLYIAPPSDEFFIDNFAQWPSDSLKQLDVKEKWYNLPIYFDNIQTSETVWYQVSPDSDLQDQSQNPNNQSILDHLSKYKSYSFLKIKGSLKQTVDFSDGSRYFEVQISNRIEFVYEAGLLREFLLQIDVTGLRDSVSIKSVLSINILNLDYAPNLPRQRDYPLVEKIRYFYASNRVLIFSLEISLMSLIIIGVKLRSKAAKK